MDDNAKSCFHLAESCMCKVRLIIQALDEISASDDEKMREHAKRSRSLAFNLLGSLSNISTRADYESEKSEKG